MKQDKKYKEYDLVFFQTSVRVWYGRVISNCAEYLELNLSDKGSFIRRFPWDEIKDIRLAEEAELDDV